MPYPNPTLYPSPTTYPGIPVPAELTYATVAQLRAQAGFEDIDEQVAINLLLDAEDLIDEYLGVRYVDPATGRKVRQVDVEAWQWNKLNRATIKLAVLLHTDPSLTGAFYTEVSGPEFSVKGLIGSRFGTSIDALLNQSGLCALPHGLGSISMAWSPGPMGGELLAN